MTHYQRGKVISLTQFDIGRPPEPDFGPVVPCPAQGLAYDVCDEPNCSRDCAFAKALGMTIANAA